MTGATMLVVLVVLGGSPETTDDATADDSGRDLDALIQEALAAHPQLEQARQTSSALAEVPSRAGSLPDPRVMLAGQNVLLDWPPLSPMTGVALGLSQMVPFPGKLGRRADIASAMHGASLRATDVAEARVVERVENAYWEVHFAERSLAVVEESVLVLDTLTNVVHARYGVGQAAQQDALQAQVAHSRVRARVEVHRQALDSARRRLNAAVGRTPNAQCQ